MAHIDCRKYKSNGCKKPNDFFMLESHMSKVFKFLGYLPSCI